jgi:hypothetical protein
VLELPFFLNGETIWRWYFSGSEVVQDILTPLAPTIDPIDPVYNSYFSACFFS